MSKKFKITVDGRTYSVVVEEESGSAASAPSVSPSVAAPIAAAPAAPVAAPPPPPAAPAGSGDVVAPLAGVIDSVEVRVGQTVKVGDKVAVIEAMKMKTEVFAKMAGTIARVAVKSAEAVETGQVMMTIE